MAAQTTDTRSSYFDMMDAIRVLDLPRNNPCAQCGEPIALPSWVEKGDRRTSYLWHCRACNYRYETIAFFAEPVDHEDALAA